MNIPYDLHIVRENITKVADFQFKEDEKDSGMAILVLVFLLNTTISEFPVLCL